MSDPKTKEKDAQGASNSGKNQNKDTTKNTLNTLSDIENEIESRILTDHELANQQLHDIIKLLPEEIKDFIEDAFTYKRIPKEYSLSSILFAYSNAAGLAFHIECMNYTNYGNLYFAIIGSRGDAKSAAIDIATEPLNKFDSINYKNYKEKLIEAKKNNFDNQDRETINRKRLFIQNATIESAMYEHEKNKMSIGLLIDELSSLIEKMANKNTNEGSEWRTFLLQGSTNKFADVSRKTTESYRLEKTYPTMIGSIQHQFIPKMLGNGNLESGFIDRILFVNKLTNNIKIAKTRMPQEVIENYERLLISLFRYRESIENSQLQDSHRILLEEKANEKIYNYSQDLLHKQEKLSDHTKEYLSKLQINIHKLTLICHLLLNAPQGTFQSDIKPTTVDLSILLCEFYLTNFKIILSKEKKSIDQHAYKKKVIQDAIKNNIAQKTIVDLLDLSKGQVSKLFKKYRIEAGN